MFDTRSSHAPSRRTGLAALMAVVVTSTMLAPDGWWTGARQPAAHAQTLDDLDEAEDRVDELSEERDEAVTRYEETWAAIEATNSQLAELERTADDLEEQVDRTVAALEDRARTAFKRGPLEGLQVLFAADGPQAAFERVALLDAVQRRETVEVDEATAGRTALEQTRALIEEREAELDALQAELDAEAEALQAELASATEEATEIRSLVSRQRRIDRGSQQGIYACIFDQGAFRFRDTWGAPRSGGRRHKGTDVFARHDASVYAITSGVVQRRSNSGLGGIGLYLRGDDGNVYYYAHLSSIESNARVGARVTAGELVARNGATGNASASAPHVHFELHPGGGSAINTYPWLAAACY
ncbi:MAG: peptidoglycan DD-metalloendopeptidase family protein [Nitriliruptoraceae bacterium]